jgi:hypothetical protein
MSSFVSLPNEGSDEWEETVAELEKRFAKSVEYVVFVNNLCGNQTFV